MGSILCSHLVTNFRPHAAVAALAALHRKLVIGCNCALSNVVAPPAAVAALAAQLEMLETEKANSFDIGTRLHQS